MRVKSRTRLAGVIGHRVFAMLLTLSLHACSAFVPLSPDATSVGFANEGYLAHGKALKERAQGFSRAKMGEDTRWATPLLIGLLERAAKHVSDEFVGAADLVIGDLSSRDGGEHGNHGSHRTGRDADVLFYLNDERGRSVRASSFFVFDERGVSHVEGSLLARHDGLRFFDTARNWAFVRALLTDEQVPVQWIFCAAGIKQRLIDYAIAHETEPDLLLRASYVIHQPSRGNPHADHFHVRIACTARELSLGCLDRGPIWPWHRNEHEKPIFMSYRNSDDDLVEALLDPSDVGFVPE